MVTGVINTTMKEPPAFLTEAAKERIHAAKNAAQTDEIARQQQSEQAAFAAADMAAKKIEERILEKHEMKELIRESVMKGFSFEDTDGQRRFIDVTKEKLICQSIVNIDGRLKSIEGNITWAVRIVIGAVLAALLSLIIIQ